jgi:hypothetical protein
LTFGARRTCGTRGEDTRLGKQRSGQSRPAARRIDEDSSGRRTTLIIAAIVVLFLGGFIALVVVDSRQRMETGPPPGVEKIDVGGAGTHSEEPVDYEQIPPAGGVHHPVWQNSGFYSEPIRNENAVHTLEHGAVWITYRPDLSQEQIDTIRELAQSQDCILASPYPDLPAPVVASAWGYQLQLEGADDPDLERFIEAYRQGPQTPEPGAACTGGIGEPAQ